MAESTDWIARLNDVSKIGNLDSALTRLLFLPIAAFFVQASNAIEALSRVVIDPTMAFATGVESIVASLLGGSAEVIGTGAATSAGDLSYFGIGAFPIGLGLVFVVAYMYAWYTDEESTGNLLPFVPFDVPIIGSAEEED